MRDRPNSSSLQVCDQVCDLDSVMEFGLKHADLHVEGRAMLRSANYGELVEPRTRGKHYGPRSFRVAAPILSGTIYHDISETITLVVNNSLAI